MAAMGLESRFEKVAIAIAHKQRCSFQRKPLTRRLLAATSDLMQSARHAEGNDAGHTRGQEAAKTLKGGMA